MIVGINDQTREIIRETGRKKNKGFEIAGILTTIKDHIGEEIQGIPVVDHIDRLESAAREYGIDRIVVTLRDRRGKLPVHELLRSKVRNIRVQEGFSFYESIKRKIPIDEYLKPSWFIFEDGFYRTTLHGSIKRWQGVIISLLILLILSPILIFLAILIKLESPGPVFFQQERVGRNGKIFRLLKFRSMRNDAEATSGPVFAGRGRPAYNKDRKDYSKDSTGRNSPIH